MNIVEKFNMGTITVSNLKSEDKLHFNFDINISTQNISYTYHFGEALCFSVYDFIDRKQEKLYDEDSMNSYLEMTKEYFGIVINQEGVTSNIKLNFNMWEDQDKLINFLIELKATCDVLLQK